jgi:hypothetical protein
LRALVRPIITFAAPLTDDTGIDLGQFALIDRHDAQRAKRFGGKLFSSR